MEQATKQDGANVAQISPKNDTTHSVRKDHGGVRVRMFTRDEDAGDNGDIIRAMRRYESNAVADPFQGVYGAQGDTVNAVIEPHYYPNRLLAIPHENNTLRQCIDAYVTNIEGFGYRLEFIGPEGQEGSSEAEAEKARLEGLLNQPNGEITLTEMRERRRRDQESIGCAYLEVARDKNGEITMIHHLPAHLMRMTKKDEDYTPITRVVNRNGKLATIKTRRRFRRFVQMVRNEKVYFKEFGDPRIIDPVTGQVNDALPIEEQATEVFYSGVYAPGHAYGLPRWINQLPAILGSREAEMTNLQFFKDNAIPAMAVLVSGGLLAAESAAMIENHFTKTRGRDSMNRIMVIEARGDEGAGSIDGKLPSPKLDIKPLMADRASDALFQEYDKNNSGKVRSSFRLPPIFIGYSDDYTRATADASLVMAEGQVFGPERSKVDDEFHQHLLADSEGRPPQYWRFRSLPARLVASDAIVDALNVLDSMGAMTPNIAIGITNELFDLNIQTIESEWGNYPFQMVTELMKKGTNLPGMEALQSAIDETNDAITEDNQPNEEKTTGEDRFSRRLAARKRQLNTRKKLAKVVAVKPLIELGRKGEETET